MSRAFQYGFLPGSTFKTVTSAAVYDHQPALAKLDVPPARCIPLPQSDKQLCNYGRRCDQRPRGRAAGYLPARCQPVVRRRLRPDRHGPRRRSR